MSPPSASPARPPASPRPTAKRRVPLPAVDERLVMPETRFEVIDGKVLYVSPAAEPHGSRHSKISALLEAYVAPGYEVAVDMLTRTAVKGDLAPLILKVNNSDSLAKLEPCSAITSSVEDALRIGAVAVG